MFGISPGSELFVNLKFKLISWLQMVQILMQACNVRISPGSEWFVNLKLK